MTSLKPLDLEVTVISAKHLKNVNWCNGDLKPYATFYVDPDHRLATHPDDSGSTKPVWNERFTLPITGLLRDSVFTLEIFHSKPSETPKPLVGTLHFPLSNLVDSEDPTQQIYTLELRRPSGRPQGKVRVKLAIRERPLPPPPIQDYQPAPYQSHYYSSAPPPPPRYYGEYSSSHYSFPDPNPGYYSSFYSPAPPLPPRPFFEREPTGSKPTGPSAPIDYSSSKDAKTLPFRPQLSNYSVPGGPSAPVDFAFDQQPSRGGGSGPSSAPTAESVAGTIDRLNLEEGSKLEERKPAARVGSNYDARHIYHSYTRDY